MGTRVDRIERSTALGIGVMVVILRHHFEYVISLTVHRAAYTKISSPMVIPAAVAINQPGRIQLPDAFCEAKLGVTISQLAPSFVVNNLRK